MGRFFVNLSCRVGEEYHEVIRYDTAHGYVHVHRFWESVGMQRWRRYEGRPLSEAFQAAYDDLKANWERYLELYKSRKATTKRKRKDLHGQGDKEGGGEDEP